MNERAFAEALEKAQADERLPEGTAVRDLGWRDFTERRVAIVTAYEPPLIDDGREHDHLVTPAGFGGEWADGGALIDAVVSIVDRHLAEWGLLVDHRAVRPIVCSHAVPYSRAVSG